MERFRGLGCHFPKLLYHGDVPLVKKMVKSDQPPVVSVAWQVLNIADIVPDTFGRNPCDYELSWSFGDETAITYVLQQGSQ